MRPDPLGPDLSEVVPTSRQPRSTAPPAVPGYELGDLLGRGSLGTVWTATRLGDGVRVAVKVVSLARADEAAALARELAVLGRVHVDGLVGFQEAIWLDTEQPSVALVLDLMGGGSLARAVAARDHLSVGESVTLLTPVARTLAGLHAVGVVHGDVTPTNVLLELSGRPFLADLGIARLVGERPADSDEYVWGTEGFVAPEVLAGAPPTPASDVYAVGALAWWCVTGAVPPAGPLRPPLAEVLPGLPAAWSEATTQALLGDPSLRPTAAELALAYYDSATCEPLRMVVGADETSLLTQRLRRTPTPVVSEEPARHRRPAADRARAWRPERARVVALASLLAVATLLGVGGLLATGVLTAPTWAHLGSSEAPARIAAGKGSASGAGSAPSTGTSRPATSARKAPTPGAKRAPSTGTSSPASSAQSGPSAGATPAPAAPPTPDPAAQRPALQHSPQSVMVALASLRARAMNTRSRQLLGDLDAPGSSALLQDTETLADLSRSGTSWREVTIEVTSARLVRASGDTATVDAVVGTAAYRVVAANGRVERRAAVPGRSMRFELWWSGGRWRVAGVSEPPR